MTNNVKTLIKMLSANGFSVCVYSENMIFVEEGFDRLHDLLAVYGQSQLGAAVIRPCGTVDYLVDEINFTYTPF